jgi:hypothetical protein
MNNRRTFFIALLFLATIVACVVPGLPTASAPALEPTADTSRIPTMVAATVAAAIMQTEQAQPMSTLPPSSDITFTPTSAPVEEPAPPASSSQSTLTKQEDGSTLFVDERAGYEIAMPAGWLTVRISEQEYLDSFWLDEAANTHIQQALLNVQFEDPNVLRLLALDTQPAHVQNEFVTNIRFVLDEQKNISLSSDADLQAIAAGIPASAEVFRFEVTSVIFRFEVTSVKIVTSASGIQFGEIDTKSSFTNSTGVEVGIYQKRVFFNSKAGTQSIIFTSATNMEESLLPVFDSMLETIKIDTK